MSQSEGKGHEGIPTTHICTHVDLPGKFNTRHTHTTTQQKYTVIIANAKHKQIHNTVKIFIVKLQKYCVSKPARYFRLTYNVR